MSFIETWQADSETIKKTGPGNIKGISKNTVWLFEGQVSKTQNILLACYLMVHVISYIK